MRFFLPAAGAALICFLAGCNPQSRNGAAQYLPESNICYNYTSYTEFFNHLSDVIDAAHQGILQTNLSAEDKFEWSSKLAAVRLAIVSCGLNENISSGTSSTRLPGPKAQFKTTRVLCTGSEPEGLLWQFHGNRQINLPESLKNLPEDTLAAVLLPVDVQTISENLKELIQSQENAAILPSGQSRLFQSISGTWVLIIRPGEDGIYTELSLPDQHGLGRKFLQNFLQQTPDGTCNIPLDNKNLQCRVEFSANRILITSKQKSPEPNRKLLQLPAVQSSLPHLPADGIGIIYLSANAGAYIQPARLDALREMPNMLGVLTRKPDALILQTVSDWNPVSEKHLIPAVLTDWPQFLKVLLWADQFSIVTAAMQKNHGCSDHIQILRKAAADYAAAHNGKFPAASGIDGVRELLNGKFLDPAALVCPSAPGDTPAENAEKFTADNCSYVYVGGSTTSTPADFPLFFDWPLNHKDQFNVITVSGKVYSFQLKELNSCRKIASFLQSRFLYPEQEFLRLLKTADSLDAAFLKGHSK